MMMGGTASQDGNLAQLSKLRSFVRPSGEDLFFLENTMILGQKLGNLKAILSEYLFFLENTLILGRQFNFVDRSGLFCYLGLEKSATVRKRLKTTGLKK